MQNKRIRIGLASPEDIRKRSRGEVTKPETINYKSFKPEKDGLFDERIFGPYKNYECSCAKYKKIKNKGKVCERCGVEITESIVRRERMGHIELAEPIAHIWMLKATPSRIALLLNLKVKHIEEVVYFVSYIVLEKGECSELNKLDILDLSSAKSSTITRNKLSRTLKLIIEKLDPESFEYEFGNDLIEELSDYNNPFSMRECSEFIERHTGAKFGIGAAAIQYLLKNLNLEEEIKILKANYKSTNSHADRLKIMKRLEVYDGLYKSDSKPEWMILTALPVMPPDIRPIIQLDGGRFTTSEINDLYRRIIIRNERLKKIIKLKAPSIIINNEKRMLQEAVDALLDNERKARPVVGKDKRALKSITSILKGKQGRFRQNLLGKRVDYSGRSVIVVGPELKMYQCGLPRKMAITLYKPFVIRILLEKEIAQNVKMADRMIENRDARIWECLEEAIKERPVMLNRAPTLHRLGIQAFEPVLTKGKAIRLHPLVTTAFNADFDGDQMAVHLLITDEAVAEARWLMMGSNSILGPKDGLPIATPTQDMVLGNYYLTKEAKNKIGEGTIFATYKEALMAYENNKIHLHSIIAIQTNALKDKLFKDQQENKLLVTTFGKLLFNNIFNETFPYVNSNEQTENLFKHIGDDIVPFGTDIEKHIAKIQIREPFKKKTLSNIIQHHFDVHGSNKTAEMLDKLKDLGFKYSQNSCATVSMSDATSYTGKTKLFNETDKYVQEIYKMYNMGMLSETEKKRLICNKWDEVKNKIQSKLEKVLSSDKENPIFMMSDSGARGNVSNFTQLVGMRGLMNNPKGEVIEIPIKSSFREGLSVAEFFISTHGARKGMADVALKTADSGYLTRRLVDVSQEIIITEKDCNGDDSFLVTDIIDNKHNDIIVPLFDRIKGRYLASDILDKKGDVVVKADTLITKELAHTIVDVHNIKEVQIYSVLTCKSDKGVCAKCYGVNLTNQKKVNIGTAVGVIAAQSIGEPGTQLTMRTFHTGGVAGGADITQGLPRIKELLDVTKPKGAIATIASISGVVKDIFEENNIYHIKIENKKNSIIEKTLYNSILRVKKGDVVSVGEKLTEGSINIKDLLMYAGTRSVQNYILKEVQRVYRLQGIEIADKYIEIIIKQMLNKVEITHSGDSKSLPGEIMHIHEFKQIVKKCIIKGENPPKGIIKIFGIKKAPLKSKSFLSSASFQDTTRILVKAIAKRAIDPLEGLKENIMLGNLIPAGTGLMKKEDIIFKGEEYKNNQY